MAIEKLIQIENIDGVTVLTIKPVAASIQGTIVDEIARELAAAIHHGSPWVLVDMEEVEFFNSAFIEQLILSWNQIQNMPGGRFALCRVQPYCREVLEITHLTHVWPVYSSRDEAIAILQANSADEA